MTCSEPLTSTTPGRLSRVPVPRRDAGRTPPPASASARPRVRHPDGLDARSASVDPSARPPPPTQTPGRRILAGLNVGSPTSWLRYSAATTAARLPQAG
uniref:Uncharacterized protein n=1 Tax=Setaria viridis TaxID=4556 RepID=A0A4U6V0E0_SETVI|nr:hypothetical protein SEVIR_4G063103v2 [Setaria viridis]